MRLHLATAALPFSDWRACCQITIGGLSFRRLALAKETQLLSDENRQAGDEASNWLPKNRRPAIEPDEHCVAPPATTLKRKRLARNVDDNGVSLEFQ